jgi:hypothetical protein
MLATLHGWLVTASDTSHSVALTEDGIVLLKKHGMV